MVSGIISAAIDRSRTVILVLLFIIVSGMLAFISIPKESDPDVAIPIIYVSIPFNGIAPDDAVRLLVRPMEKELKTIEGIKELRSTGAEGHASIVLEFEAGFDSEQAMLDVREKVDIAKTSLPDGAEEPSINEINVALFPVMNIALSGNISERIKLKIAKDLKEEIEGIAGVLKVEIAGEREEQMEIIVEPQALETYQLDLAAIMSSVSKNNQLVAAGAIDSGNGRQVLKVPGVVENLNDMLRMPIKSSNGVVVTLGDVATLKMTYKDSQGYARVNGEPALVLEITKQVGANIIETIEQVRAVVEFHQKKWPAALNYAYILDQSTDVREMLSDLMNNVLSGIILVMIVILAAMGVRTSLLVGLAIPGSFLASIFVLKLIGFTLNIVVLFSLILVVGMLVDGAIVVTELAQRRQQQGLNAKDAFKYAASRMAWPVIAGTMTTLVVFMPLMFWPGVIGQFMKYLPATVLVCLTASLFMALIFIPVLGAVTATKKSVLEQPPHNEYQLPAGRFNTRYRSILSLALRWPMITLLITLLFMVCTGVAYSKFGNGVEFFPDVEPDRVLINVHARGEMSVDDKDLLLRRVEKQVRDVSGYVSIYARSYNQNPSDDIVGVIQFQLDEWDAREPAANIMKKMQQATANIPGIVIETRKEESGPSSSKPFALHVSGIEGEEIFAVVARIRQKMEESGGFVGAEDNRPLPGIEWKIIVDRTEAARYGANVAAVGEAVKLITSGIKLTSYRPESADDEVDIRLRFPKDKRNLDQLMQMQLLTSQGMISLSNFISLKAGPKTGAINRTDSRRVVVIQAEVEEGVLVADKVREMQLLLEKEDYPANIRIAFKGEQEDQDQTGAFLAKAFSIAIFMMLLILVTQFNQLYQAFLVLSAIVFSTAGVLLGLMITGQPFGIVMGGVGIIALAGIVVNNNIVLIDCYNDMRKQGFSPQDAALHTGSIRLRPVLLTAITTVLGLLPMVLAMNIDLINRDISFGAPSTQWWTQLSSTIAGGLSFATVLTLFLTPCLLVIGEKDWLGLLRRKQRSSTEKSTALDPIT